MEQLVPEKAKISPFLVFFLVHTMQFGIGYPWLSAHYRSDRRI